LISQILTFEKPLQMLQKQFVSNGFTNLPKHIKTMCLQRFCNGCNGCNGFLKRGIVNIRNSKKVAKVFFVTLLCYKIGQVKYKPTLNPVTKPLQMGKFVTFVTVLAFSSQKMSKKRRF